MKKLTQFLTGILVLLLYVTTTDAATIDPKLESVLKSIPYDETLPVIIRLQKTVTKEPLQRTFQKQHRTQFIKQLKKNAELTQLPILNFLKERGAKKTTRLWLINGIATRLTREDIHELSLQPGLAAISLDQTISLPEPEVSEGSEIEAEGSLELIRAPELWSIGHTGEGMVIASMDTGVDFNHQDLADRWRGGENSWYDPYGEWVEPHDRNGHGTQVMGILIGGSAGGTSIGVAPGAQWIAVKIFNNDNDATLSGIHKGFQWLLDPDNNTETDDAPDVINNSWGLGNTVNTCNDEFQEDIQALKNAGIALAFSAGNGGPFPSTSESPANYPESFAVGALEDNSTIMISSSRGPSACDLSSYPEVVAPGVNIRTADLTFGGVLPDSYTYVTGTSFAAAHVSGAMAVLLSAFPCATIPQLESALKDSAIDLGFPGPDNNFGYGRIDMMAAYTVLMSAGIPTTCTETDEDNDEILDTFDNCPKTPNPDQNDTDGDGIGNVCDNCTDSDEDGYGDLGALNNVCPTDSCQGSETDSTVIIDGCDSSVENQPLGEGCKMSDLIAQCAQGKSNHGTFVSCVAHLTNDWKEEGYISEADKEALQECAAGSLYGKITIAEAGNVTISLFKWNCGLWQLYATTSPDSEGIYSFCNVPGGTYKVEADHGLSILSPDAYNNIIIPKSDSFSLDFTETVD
jgi:serine protease AprX